MKPSCAIVVPKSSQISPLQTGLIGAIFVHLLPDLFSACKEILTICSGEQLQLVTYLIDVK